MALLDVLAENYKSYCSYHRYQLKYVGIVGAIGFPLFYFIYTSLVIVPYENLPVRLIAALLCVFLAAKEYWPKKIKHYYDGYAYFTVLYILPFFHVFMSLKNDGNIVFVVDSFMAVFFLVLLTDWRNTIAMLLIGSLLGSLLYIFTTTSPTFPIDFMLRLPTFILVVIGGSLFKFSEKQIQDAKNQDLIALTKAAHEIRHLQLENELNQAIVAEQKHFREIVRKVAHDINSPLAALNMMLDTASDIPEDKRLFFRRATRSILDIANNLLSNDCVEENAISTRIEYRWPLLVSDLLSQLLSEKKVQYQNLPVTFELIIANDAQFAFIQAQKTEFQRAISNLINNAVDSLEIKDDGTIAHIVIVQLTADDNSVVIKVKDNGKGMQQDKVDKIRQHQSFTDGKKNGHGLGLQQVWEMLDCNGGDMAIHSDAGKGTSIQLTFPRIAASSWIAQEIHLNPYNIIVILDDDQSIHQAWDLRFASFLESSPSLRLHHFIQGQEALDFLGELSSQEKNHVLFLSDYELLYQSRDGLQIIEISQVTSAILVTSYYSHPQVRDIATQLNVKMLPKQMAAIIPIDFRHSIEEP